MRAVIDTNVLLSGLLWPGQAHLLIEQIRAGTLTLVSSPALLAELAEVAARPKFKDILARSNTNPELMVAQVRLLAEIIDPPPLPEPVSRDPDDDDVLALAAAARPDIIITGDKISSFSVLMAAFPSSARPKHVSACAASQSSARANTSLLRTETLAGDDAVAGGLLGQPQLRIAGVRCPVDLQGMLITTRDYDLGARPQFA